MANGALLLLITLLATARASGIASATASSSGTQQPSARRSRFLLVGGAAHLPLVPVYECSKKSGEACLATGTTCCSGQCVDTVASTQHCGGCNKACKHGRTCCAGLCVDLLSDKKNCGACSNQCDNKCSYGFCDYAQ